MLDDLRECDLLNVDSILQINPIYYKGEMTTCNNNWHFKNITVGFDKFYFIEDGECVIEIDGHKHIAKPYQIFLLPNNSCQTLYIEGDKIVRKYWFHCTLFCGKKDFTEIIKLPYFIDVKDIDYVENLFKCIIAAEKEMTLTAKLKQKADILRLLSYYLKYSDTADNNISYDNRITYILTYIEENLNKDLKLEDLCNLVHFQPSYFIRFFKKETGTTPVAYILNRRIALAQKLLLDKTLTIKDIGIQCGFRNLYYFLRYFKKKTGLSPTEYRQLAAKKHINR